MRTFFQRRRLLGLIGLMLVAGAVMAHPPPPPKATSDAAIAGTNNSAFITPLTLALAIAAGGGPQVLTNTVNNLTVVSNAYFLQDVHFNGKVTLNSNVTVNALNFKTNAAAVTTLNLGNNYQYLKTNNNVAYTGFTGILAGETNVQWCTVLWTNTSGSLQTMTLAGTVGDATHYCTNQTAITVVRYPLAGTNVVSRPLN